MRRLNTTFIRTPRLKTYTCAVLLYNYTHFPDLICMVQIIPGCEHPTLQPHRLQHHGSLKMHTDFFYLLFLFLFFFPPAWWEVICCNAWSGCFEKSHLISLRRSRSPRGSPAVPVPPSTPTCWSWKILLQPKLNETSHPSAFPSSVALSHTHPSQFLLTRKCVQHRGRERRK